MLAAIESLKPTPGGLEQTGGTGDGEGKMMDRFMEQAMRSDARGRSFSRPKTPALIGKEFQFKTFWQ